jgi:predicted enzyme related to lactoylglutathione lyase
MGSDPLRAAVASDQITHGANNMAPSLAFNHVGLTIPDIFAAIDWYSAVFGASHIMGPRLLAASSVATHETPSIFGPRFRKAYQAHLLLANGVGLELFQFVEPPVETPDENMPYWVRGPFHIALTCADVDGLAEAIVAKGGRMRCAPANFVPGRPWRLCYCEDPWGTVIEIMSASYAEMFANWPQPGMAEPPTFIDRGET